MAEPKSIFLRLPLSLPFTPLNRPLHDNLIPDPHPVIPFSFSSLSPFLPEIDGQTDLSRIIIWWRLKSLSGKMVKVRRSARRRHKLQPADTNVRNKNHTCKKTPRLYNTWAGRSTKQIYNYAARKNSTSALDANAERQTDSLHREPAARNVE